MPLIRRIETDIFVFSEVTSYMINPVNIKGIAGAGLAKEFRKRVPSFFVEYEKACKAGELRIGSLQVYEDTGQSWGMINFPTKRDPYDLSTLDDIKRGLEALRTLLKEDKYRYSVIGLPMLGCGLGKQDYSVVYPVMVEMLEDLDATIFLSMAPDKTEMHPKYLTIAGPLDYGRDDKEKATIDWVIEKTLDVWKASLDDYTGIVSGGYPGVDAYVCGTEFGKAVVSDPHGVPYQDTYAYKKTEKLPIVCKPDVYRNGVSANLHLGNLLCEIGEDIILFKPKGHNNNRLAAMQAWLASDAQRREQQGLFPRRVAVFGEKDMITKPDNVLIPQLEDIPY